MNIFRKRSYDSVVKALEAKERENNGLRVQLSVSQDEVAALRKELEEKEEILKRAKYPLPGRMIDRISAPTPEKKRGYIMALQKELVKYVKEKDGEIYIDIVHEID